MTSASSWSMNARRGKEGEVVATMLPLQVADPSLQPVLWAFDPSGGFTLSPLWGRHPQRHQGCSAPQSRRGACPRRQWAVVWAVIGLSLLGNAVVFAQAGATSFVNNTPFTVHIVAGSGRTEVCTLAPHSTGTGQGVFGQTEYFYPVFDVPLTAVFSLKDTRTADPNFFYQIDGRRGSAPVIIGSVPPLGDNAAYIVLVNTSRTGGASVARTASSRLSRIDAGGDNVNAGERGVFRVNPRDDNGMRVASPVNVAFPSIVYRPGYRYVFAFDGAAVTLVDARPLHAIGLPLDAALVFEGAVPEGEREALRKALNDGLAAANAPLRVPPGSVETGDGPHDAPIPPESGDSGTEHEGGATADGGNDTGDEGGVDGFSVSPEDGGVAADGAGDADDVRYVFVVTLATAKRTVPFPTNREMYTGEVTVMLFRNDGVIAEYKAVVTELNEAGVYRAVRQFLAGDKQLRQAIAGAVNGTI